MSNRNECLGNGFRDREAYNLNLFLFLRRLIQVSTPPPQIPAFSTSTTSSLNRSRATPEPPVEPAADFKEDPFKNFRYEDPFLISDPFQDEEEAKPVSVEGKSKTQSSTA